MAGSEPIYFFFHIAKNGGTTIIEHIKKSLPKDQYLELSSEKIDKSESERLVAGLGEGEKDKLKVIFGHSVSADLGKYFSREARYICIVRDPVERFVSLYNYWRTLYERDSDKGKKEYKNALLIKNKVPNFDEWLSVKFKNKKADYTLRRMSRFLEDFGYKNLYKFYFVGTMDTFDDDSLFIYHALHINNFFIKKNASIKYHKPSLSDKAKIMSINKKGFVIYKKGVSLNKKFKKENKDFRKIVLIMKIKRFLVLPFSQIIFAPGQIKELIINKWHE